MINIDKNIKISWLAKIFKSHGAFIMLKTSECENLIHNGIICYNLESDDFFKLRCKLEIPTLGEWYKYDKETKGMIVERFPVTTLTTPKEIENWYHDICNANGLEITLTNVLISGHKRLIIDAEKETITEQGWLDCILDKQHLKRVDNRIVINHQQVIPAQEIELEQSVYIKRHEEIFGADDTDA